MGVMITYALLLGVMVTVWVCAHHVAQAQRSWHEGFEEHARLMDLYEMSPDDDKLLCELRTALKSHIKTAGLYRKGDSGRIDKTADWKEFKDLAWEITVKRKENLGA
jgi:hypothetical protein